MTKPANYMYMSDVVDGILLIDEEYKSVYPPMFMVHPLDMIMMGLDIQEFINLPEDYYKLVDGKPTPFKPDLTSPLYLLYGSTGKVHRIIS